jgi:hypothetical protein
MHPQQTDPRHAAKTYSPFWPVLGVFGVLIFLQADYVLEDFRQHAQIETVRVQLQPALAQARTISQTTEAVGRELVALSTNSAEAAKIISEFKIQLNKPVQAKSEN